MKKLRSTILLILTPFLIGCSNNTTAHLDLHAGTYIRNLFVDDIDDFKICVFNDLHISVLTNLSEEIAYYEKCLDSFGGRDQVKLIVLNGDVFQGAQKSQVNRFFNWINSLDIPFAYVYGNHDLQGAYHSNYIDQKLKSLNNSLLINPLNDNVFGNSNYVVNINEGDENSSTLKWQLYFFDSNTFSGVSYDIVHEDQIAWYEKQQANLINPVPSLTFLHIPTEEFREAYDIIGNNVNSGYDLSGTGSSWYMGESISHGYQANDLYETMQDFGNNKAIIVAHDHVNVTDWHYDKDGGSDDNVIHLIFGMKTGRGIYHDKRIMGASFYTLNDSDDFDINWINVPYNADPYEITPTDLVALGKGAIS
ncbi:MAG: metallophosphoesterase [Bacilli bacterium]|nr:metallophosphoesterase [Bacilli bacterium]